MLRLRLLFGALAGLALIACGACAPAARLAPTSLPAVTSSPVAAALIPSSVPALPPLPTSEPASCTFSNVKPTPGPTEVSLFAGVSQADWKVGPDGARLVFVEYGDFQ
jgi:hypothetical protein